MSLLVYSYSTVFLQFYMLVDADWNSLFQKRPAVNTETKAAPKKKKKRGA